METQKTLGLSTPERTAASSDTFLTNPRDVEDWIASLPTANVGETARQVFKTLVEFNRIEVPNIPRIKIAEVFRSPIEYIAENLRKYYYDITFPLTAKSRKIAVLNRELYAELAIAYKIFIEEMISGRNGKFDKKLLVIALHRAIRCLGKVNYQSAIVYDPFPVRNWREINLLYAFAEQNRIHHIPVKEGRDKSNTTSISDAYKEILLFAICSPYRQRQREILQIKEMLPQLAEKISVEKHLSSMHVGSDFIVQLNQDSPPLHIELMHDKLSDHSRIITTQELIDHLRAEFDLIPTTGKDRSPAIAANNQITKHLYRQLIRILSSPPKREYVRTKLNFELKTAVGLTAIHTLLSSKPVPAEPDSEMVDGETIWLNGEPRKSSYSHQRQQLSLSGINTPETQSPNTDYNYTQEPSWANKEDKEDEVETFICKTLNESAGGYCIHWHGANTPKIRVGEIIGIQSATNQNQFSIGISRWMKNAPNSGLQLGLEMISPGSIPVTVQRQDANDFSNTQHKGLLLPEMKSSGKSASVIVGTLLFKVGDHLTMSNDSGQSTIRLTRLLESTGAFSQFQFVYQARSGKQHLEDDEGENSDFENIWSMI